MSKAKDIINFWFSEDVKPNWFKQSPELSKKLQQFFMRDYAQAVKGELDYWRDSPEGALALILLLDSMPRHFFPNSPSAYATDEVAREITEEAVMNGFDCMLSPEERFFLLLPYEHSETLEDLQFGYQLFKDQFGDSPYLDYAAQRLHLVEKFGRFPQRNQILGRASTLEEKDWLSNFDQKS